VARFVAAGGNWRGVPRIDEGMEAGAGVQNFREGGGLGGFARSGSEVKVRRMGDGV